MDVHFKQCPVCGAANPKNNSECCRCHGDMTNVPIPLFEDDGKPLPEQGYQPTLAVDEVEHIIMLGMLVAVAQMSVTILSPDVPQPLNDAVVCLRRDVVIALLRRKFERTPTTDEIVSLESAMIPGTMVEGVKRFHRLMTETSIKTIHDLSPELEQMYRQLYLLNDQMIQFMERHRDG